MLPGFRLNHLNIVTTDLERSFQFYTTVLGMDYVGHLDPNKIVLDCHGFHFFIEKAESVDVHPNVHFGLLVEARGVEAFAKRLEKFGIPMIKGNGPSPGVYTTPDGSRTALYFQDPDGWTIEIYSAV